MVVALSGSWASATRPALASEPGRRVCGADRLRSDGSGIGDDTSVGVAAFVLSRVRSLFSSSRDLAVIARRDPEHLPERLALFAVHRLGEPSRVWARDALADGANPGVVATRLRHRSGRVARIDGAISGTPFFLALVPGYLGYLWQEAMMVLRTAALYGHDPGALRTGAQMLALRGIHPSVEAAQAAIEHVDATPLPDRPEHRRPVVYWVRSVRMILVFGGFLSPPSSRDVDRPHAKLLAAVGLIVGAGVWVFTWIFPATFMIFMAWSCERDARRMGWNALAFYGGEAATTQAAIEAARLRRDEGHTWRQLVRAGALTLSVALPIAFIVIAIRYRNTRGPLNEFSIAGALVALSLVIAITVAVNRG